MEDLQQARRDVEREPEIFLNGVRFRGDALGFFSTLERLASSLVDRVCRADERRRHDAEWRLRRSVAVADELVLRSARTAAGSDSYFFARRLLGLDVAAAAAASGESGLFGGSFTAPFAGALDLARSDGHCRRYSACAADRRLSTEYVVMPRREYPAAQRCANDQPRALDLELRLSRGRIRARVRCRNAYSVRFIPDDEDDEDGSRGSAARYGDTAHSSSEDEAEQEQRATPLRSLSPASVTEWLALFTTVTETVDFTDAQDHARAARPGERYLSVSLTDVTPQRGHSATTTAPDGSARELNFLRPAFFPDHHKPHVTRSSTV